MATQLKSEVVSQSYSELLSLRNKIVDFEQEMAGELSFVAAQNLDNARNLVHYIGFKQQDITLLQSKLLVLGLNPLENPESNVLYRIDVVLGALAQISKLPSEFNSERLHLEKPLVSNSETFIGALPQEAAHNYQVGLRLLEAGINLFKVSSAHGDQNQWSKMIHNLHRASLDSGRKCLIMFDLDSSIRIGEFQQHSPVLKLEPERNEKGQVIRNAVVRFVMPGYQSKSSLPEIPIEKLNYHLLKNNDVIYLRDSAERSRRLNVTEVKKDYIEAETDKTIYLDSGIRIMFLRKSEIIDHANIGKLPSVEFIPTLFNGDELIITSLGTLGEPAICNDKGQILQPARISCTCQSVFNDVKPGERVFFNKGKLEGITLKVKENEILVKITRSGKRGTELHRGDSMAFPDSNLHLPILTETDLQYLEFASQHADAIEIPASCKADDLKSILQLMNEKLILKMGLVMKVDSVDNLKNLPLLMLTGMQRNLIGLEICPGKLAIGQSNECVVEAQEQLIRWCSAARIPVIRNNTSLLESIKRAPCN
ncbi:MAG: hypothetical protein JZU47_21640 [Prolixibacteraceae bacterium]|nr:hypothetical protein [Prolixibacteraceae bacterium]